MKQRKILIIRFSSIGDIVLTTPIIRCMKNQLNSTEIHFVTKDVFKDVLINNPNVDKLHVFKKDISELYDQLIKEKFDIIIDLHKNLRSLRLKQKLKIKSYSFNKLNTEKFLAVNLKLLNRLPNKHIVDRYFEAVYDLGVIPDSKGLDYFIHQTDIINIDTLILNSSKKTYLALVIGGSYFTKKISLTKLNEICEKVTIPIILLGGKEDKEIEDKLKEKFPDLIGTCGQFSINQSASIIKQAEWVITSDTGLMHIAAAYNKKIISLWGNTIPEFGMTPYLPNKQNKILEIKKLSCRPCSKLGYKKCPRGHFKCMNTIDVSFVSEVNEFL